MFKRNMNKILYGSNPLDVLNMSTPWDIEDLVQAGKKKRCCPYFTSRELLPKAEIVFCPYNYIIDPLIRRSVSNVYYVSKFLNHESILCWCDIFYIHRPLV
jgi:Fanconi anemia group J protein